MGKSGRRSCPVRIFTAVLAAVLLALPGIAALAAPDANTEPLSDYRSIPGWPSDMAPGVSAEAAVAIDLASAQLMYDKNGEEVLHPASITKVLTALVVLENCGLDELVEFSSEDVNNLEEGGNNWEMVWAGETLTVRDCLYALLLNSVNECGMALARHTAGSVEAFSEMMNEKAASLGCTSSHFTNPHGLNDEEHVTTARDMALILRACVQNEAFLKIASTVTYTIEGTEQNPSGMTCYNHDRMMRQDSEYYNSNVVCGKTGYTSICGNTLVTYAEKGDKQIIVTILKDASAPDSYVDTTAILNYCFDQFHEVDMVESAEAYLESLSNEQTGTLTMQGRAHFLLPNSVALPEMDFQKQPQPGSAGILSFLVGDTVLTTRQVTSSGGTGTGGSGETEEGQPETTASSGISGNTDPVSSPHGILFWILVFIAIIAGVITLIGIISYAARVGRRKQARRRRREQYRRNQGGTGRDASRDSDRYDGTSRRR